MASHHMRCHGYKERDELGVGKSKQDTEEHNIIIIFIHTFAFTRVARFIHCSVAKALKVFFFFFFFFSAPVYITVYWVGMVALRPECFVFFVLHDAYTMLIISACLYLDVCL
jgi:hypothetical protein